MPLARKRQCHFLTSCLSGMCSVSPSAAHEWFCHKISRMMFPVLRSASSCVHIMLIRPPHPFPWWTRQFFLVPLVPCSLSFKVILVFKPCLEAGWDSRRGQAKFCPSQLGQGWEQFLTERCWRHLYWAITPETTVSYNPTITWFYFLTWLLNWLWIHWKTEF